MNLIGGQALMYLAGPLISKILEEMAYTIEAQDPDDNNCSGSHTEKLLEMG